jgi:hypothetical protein
MKYKLLSASYFAHLVMNIGHLRAQLSAPLSYPHCSIIAPLSYPHCSIIAPLSRKRLPHRAA